MRQIVRHTAVLVVVLSLGLHWAVLQVVAWTGMLVSYSQRGSIAEAVGKTFDGQHPCPLCKAIEQGRSEEKKQKQTQAGPGSKLDPGIPWCPVEYVFDSSFLAASTEVPILGNRLDPPPKPRPRSIFAGGFA